MPGAGVLYSAELWVTGLARRPATSWAVPVVAGDHDPSFQLHRSEPDCSSFW